jgi:iron complex transport system ATP-binding protein
MTAAAILSTRALTLTAGGRTLVRGLTWQVRPGECWSIIGRNGAGKSTLIRTLAGLHPPAAGAVELKGRAIDAWPPAELARERAYLPQARHDAFAYTAFETVLAARHPYHANRYWEGSDDHHAAMRALAALDAAGLARRDVRTLSGGERQRVAIAALLAQDTPLLLLDEPANALDLAHQVRTMHLLARLCRAQGRTVVMIGHDLTLACGVSTHALLLDGIGAWHAGPVDEVMQPALLGRVLGHPIDVIERGARRIFIPHDDHPDEESP